MMVATKVRSNPQPNVRSLHVRKGLRDLKGLRDGENIVLNELRKNN